MGSQRVRHSLSTKQQHGNQRRPFYFEQRFRVLGIQIVLGISEVVQLFIVKWNPGSRKNLERIL